jgi:hypothetical protein
MTVSMQFDECESDALMRMSSPAAICLFLRVAWRQEGALFLEWPLLRPTRPPRACGRARCGRSPHDQEGGAPAWQQQPWPNS